MDELFCADGSTENVLNVYKLKQTKSWYNLLNESIFYVHIANPIFSLKIYNYPGCFMMSGHDCISSGISNIMSPIE